MSANTPRSRKAKGREFQNQIRERLLEIYSNLEPDDIKCSLMSESGVDIKLSPYARKIFPYSIEAKRQESLNVWSSLKQAETNTVPGTKPLLVFKRNRSEIYVALKFEDFLSLIDKRDDS